MKLNGRTVLVTGGSTGIGFEMAAKLLARGNTVIITGRDAGKLAKAKAKLPKVHTIQSDVSEPKEIEKLFSKVTSELPELDVLINNAGIMRTTNLGKNSESLKDFTHEIDINLKGPVRMVKQFLPFLKQKSSAAIVNVSSGLAFVPLPTSPIYCSTKAALHSFTLSLRVQLKNTNVQVFEIAPPATQTEMTDGWDPEDTKGIAIMKVEEMVRLSLLGIEKGVFEITPGQSSQLKLMSRLAPKFILGQLSKPVERMLAK